MGVGGGCVCDGRVGCRSEWGRGSVHGGWDVEWG